MNVFVEVVIWCLCQFRPDYGTENGLLAASQIAFRLQHTDSLAGSKSFMYGHSTGNIVRVLMYIYSEPLLLFH